MIFVATKKGRTTNFFSPFSFVAVFGSGILDQRSEIRDPRSGIRDWQKSGSGIRNKHPGSARLLVSLPLFFFAYNPSCRSILQFLLKTTVADNAISYVFSPLFLSSPYLLSLFLLHCIRLLSFFSLFSSLFCQCWVDPDQSDRHNFAGSESVSNKFKVKL